MIELAEILAVLLPPLVKHAIQLADAAKAGKLTAEDVRAEVEKMRVQLDELREFDDEIDRRIDEVT